MDKEQKRIAALEQEIQYLRTLLDLHGIAYETHIKELPVADPSMGILPYTVSPEMAQYFYSIFKGRKDVYSKQFL